MNLCQNIIMTSRGQAARMSRLCAKGHANASTMHDITRVHNTATKVHNTTTKAHKLASKVHNSSTKVHNADYNDRPILQFDY